MQQRAAGLESGVHTRPCVQQQPQARVLRHTRGKGWLNAPRATSVIHGKNEIQFYGIRITRDV